MILLKESSGDAGQFKLLTHGLCWVHMEKQHRKEIAEVRKQIWDLYKALKIYKTAPSRSQRKHLSHEFDKLFTQRTSFETLNRILLRTYKNKDDLLLVLDRQGIQFHTNGSETDIRNYVKKRKVSNGTSSGEGRLCRDTFSS